MKKHFLVFPAVIFFGLAVPGLNFSDRIAAEGESRAVAVTFDDLPSSQFHDVTTLRDLTSRLIKTVTANRIPAVGFVNEVKLHQKGELDLRTEILKMWTDAGLELGNHTYSHPSLYNTPLAEFEDNVIRGEPIIRKLLAGKGMKLRYFRHPYLNAGPDLKTKTSFERFLIERGYTIAPVTFDNSEWMFAAVYNDARTRGDRALMKRVADAYVPYLEETFEFFEKLSVELFGYEVKQTLLLHANMLNADHFGDVVKMLRRRGYRFMTLEEALKDKAYRTEETHVGRVGFSWLQRWANARNHKYGPEPVEPAFIREKLENR